MCRNCSLLHTKFRTSAPLPESSQKKHCTVEDWNELHNHRSRQWLEWWRILRIGRSSKTKCVLCSKKAYSKECCAGCGGFTGGGVSDLTNRKSAVCWHASEQRLPLDCLCDGCWENAFPCLAESFGDRKEALRLQLKQKHNLDYNHFAPSSLYMADLPDILHILDYDHTVTNYLAYGRNYVPYLNDQAEPTISADETADILAERWYMRMHTDLSSLIAKNLSHKVEKFQRLLNSLDHDDPQYHCILEKVGRTLSKMIDRATKKVKATHDIPSTWPWMERPQVTRSGKRARADT
jgi:hypothetical protein